MKFEKYTQTANSILKEIAEELGFPNDIDLSGRILRAVLHTLRSRLTIQESFQLMAQLPMLLKAIYVEGWKYQEKPTRIKNIGEFIREVIHEDQPLGHHDIRTVKDGENVIRTVFKVIRNHVSEGEITHIIMSMPAELRPLWGLKDKMRTASP
ncbi:DUF2267 domain-containing protein [Marivirga arenosa]|uniref:DUF2267 domain-containing protein n=1 Tax=Marivirga arenosa TaxID=3059076 RepID=A0AA49J9W8_9BACT|nr:DUF2267 domain-containing protein [Marivirga sp. BKB1-2]WKK83325.2 DUF2267 domain-containing protein [Marivirga sp. BKB1-2]